MHTHSVYVCGGRVHVRHTCGCFYLSTCVWVQETKLRSPGLRSQLFSWMSRLSRWPGKVPLGFPGQRRHNGRGWSHCVCNQEPRKDECWALLAFSSLFSLRPSPQTSAPCARDRSALLSFPFLKSILIDTQKSASW